jgi:hypothetical protein
MEAEDLMIDTDLHVSSSTFNTKLQLVYIDEINRNEKRANEKVTDPEGW